MALYVRVDDRLIHGQIIANWAGYLNVKNIIGVDDKTAANPTLQSIMKMSVPKTYTCEILNVEKGVEKIRELAQKNENTLVIVRFPRLLERLLFDLDNVENVNIGNVSKSEGVVHEVSSNVYLSDEDVVVIDRLFSKGVDISFKTLPDSSSVNWGKVRDKFM